MRQNPSPFPSHEQRLRALGQDHVLSFWNELDEKRRSALLSDLEAIPYEALEGVFRKGVDALRPTLPPLGELEPVTLADAGGPQVDRARALGYEELAAGRVAAVTVAGGQGTRLGFSGPKGTYPIEPSTGRSFFALIAEGIDQASRLAGRPIPWYVMTSDATHEQTVAFFEEHADFGLETGQVRLFCQGTLPAISLEGRLLMIDEHRLVMLPDGHGGLVDALSRSGHLARMQEEGTRHLSVFQVDNPLVRWIDPTFLGLHAAGDADVSCKVIGKRDDQEGLGNLCVHRGRTMCIEYSDFPAEYASARNADGTRRFDAGNISIYVMGVAFLARLLREGVSLPIHLARKKIPVFEPGRGVREPAEPNAYKMERFLFDVLPHAQRVVVVRTQREEEFAAVKTLTGPDSVEACQRVLARRCVG